MITAYCIAFIPAFIGCLLWVFSKKVVIWEWLVASGVAFLTALIFNVIAVYGMTHDQEVRSGYVTSATFHPFWHAEWVELVTHTTTDSKGNVSTYTTLEHRSEDHPEHWTCDVNFGSYQKEWGISKSTFDDICKTLGSNPLEKKWVDKSNFVRGDHHIYIGRNKTAQIYPVTDITSFENRVKAAPSLFSYSKVPDYVKVFDYPYPQQSFVSNRLLGLASKDFNQRAWDCLNSQLGPIKKVNLICVGFGEDEDLSIAQWQEAKWVGGKKNDLVICYGKSSDPAVAARWCYVFGWTDSEIVKKELESLFLTTPAKELIPKIKETVEKGYTIKDWTKFDYITVEPSFTAYIWLILAMLLTQIPLWIAFTRNDESKDRNYGKDSFSYLTNKWKQGIMKWKEQKSLAIEAFKKWRKR